ncbi:hypothetical protein GCM10010350_77020 [Streptomyces galilaeus]|nr:hypothetical protein GCM10010350_77020 [Streptomyces galilaeus]
MMPYLSQRGRPFGTRLLPRSDLLPIRCWTGPRLVGGGRHLDRVLERKGERAARLAQRAGFGVPRSTGTIAMGVRVRGTHLPKAIQIIHPVAMVLRRAKTTVFSL